MNYVRIVLFVVVGLLVALLAGFLWGRSGRSAAEARLVDAEVRLDLAQARGGLLAARVDLFEVNFGRASQHLQSAKGQLQDAEKRLTDAGQASEATRVKDVNARVVQAQDQAARLDQSANTRIAEAIGILEQVIAASPGARK